MSKSSFDKNVLGGALAYAKSFQSTYKHHTRGSDGRKNTAETLRTVLKIQRGQGLTYSDLYYVRSGLIMLLEKAQNIGQIMSLSRSLSRVNHMRNNGQYTRLS
jgi:hypothetical protein